MIKCIYIGGADDDEYNRFIKIINEKYNPGKDCLINIQNRIQETYNKYLSDFENMESQEFSEFSTEKYEMKHLKNCYDSETISFQLVRGNIFERQSIQHKTFCPYCLLNKPKTLDHYMGKTEFPEYAILVRNLIPCCYDCNQKKGEVFRSNNKRRYIHFYNDNFFDHRFLYAELLFENNSYIPKIDFNLSRPEFISEEEFNIITWHFEDLDLFKEYQDRSNAMLSTEIQIIKSSFEKGNSIDVIREIISNRYMNMTELGQNYWERCVYEALYQNIERILQIN